MGLTKKHLPGRLGSGAVALGAALGLVLVGPMAPANAYTTVEWTETPLTQQELDANWITDRAVPSGDYESVTFDGREDVLEIRIDKDNRSTQSGSFYYTEGLKRAVDSVDAARIDLYIDSSWLANDTDVRAGFWGAGEPDGSGPYPIAEFTTAEADGYIGWRVWDSTIGWVNQPDIPWNEDEWATIEIVLDQSNDAFDVIIDGHVVTTPALGSTALDAVMVNQYNYGPTGQSYDVHWSSFATGTLLPTTDECKNGGWQDFGEQYKNQGQCVAAAQSNENSKHHRG